LLRLERCTRTSRRNRRSFGHPRPDPDLRRAEAAPRFTRLATLERGGSEVLGLFPRVLKRTSEPKPLINQSHTRNHNCRCPLDFEGRFSERRDGARISKADTDRDVIPQYGKRVKFLPFQGFNYRCASRSAMRWCRRSQKSSTMPH
jgi:hypothetical protein